MTLKERHVVKIKLRVTESQLIEIIRGEICFVSVYRVCGYYEILGTRGFWNVFF